MTLHTTLLAPDDPAWGQALARQPHDVYHYPGYAALCARQEGGIARAFVASDGRSSLFVPLIIRSVPDWLCCGERLRDATVPYGYPGPMISQCSGEGETAADREFAGRALHALTGRLRDERIVAAFFRLHPLLGVAPELLTEFGDVVAAGESVAIDLLLSPEERWRTWRANHRRDVNKARARGEVAAPDEEWTGFDGFRQAYRETMARVGASSYYLFDDQYFDSLRAALGEHLHLWTVRSGGQIIAGALFTECEGMVQYHLGGTLDRFLPGNPVKLMFYEAAEHFAARGNRWMNLGGGVGGAQDSLFHFKAGFSPRRFAFHTWRVVVNPVDYAGLVAIADRTTGVQSARSSFFPAYRLPTVTPSVSDEAPVLMS